MINLKVKTNGDLYRLVIKAEVPWIGQCNGEALIVSEDKDWQ